MKNYKFKSLLIMELGENRLQVLHDIFDPFLRFFVSDISYDVCY